MHNPFNSYPRLNNVPLPLRMVAVGAVTALALTACAGSGEGAPSPATTSASAETSPSVSGSPTVAPVQKEGLEDPVAQQHAAEIISTFENSTTTVQYGYSEDLGDGRGITAGRAGFTTGTSDLLEVVERYASEKPGNGLETFLPALRKVDGTESTKGLSGLPKAWRQAAADPQFRKAQDEVFNELYLDPAIKWAKKVHVSSSVGQLIILDTIVQHGEGTDPDGLPAIVREAVKKSSPEKTTEKQWLGTFLQIRRQHLMNAADPSTRQDWRESVDRVRALKSILASGNTTLTPPLKWSVYGDRFSLPK
jgi:chitosanase